MGRRYDIGDVPRYSHGSKETGIAKGTYVKSIDTATNGLTVELQDGTERTYDPRRQRGVCVFRTEMRGFSVGDRIQFTAPASGLKIADRELGAIEAIDRAGRLNLKMDSGPRLKLIRRSIRAWNDKKFYGHVSISRHDPIASRVANRG